MQYIYNNIMNLMQMQNLPLCQEQVHVFETSSTTRCILLILAFTKAVHDNKCTKQVIENLSL